MPSSLVIALLIGVPLCLLAAWYVLRRRRASPGSRTAARDSAPPRIDESTAALPPAPDPEGQTITFHPATDTAPADTPSRIGRFQPRAVLGQGGFGRVYRAYDPQLDRDVALKVPRFAPDETAQVERFLGEARAAARLRHPNIVQVYDAGQAGADYYIASEFVEGVPLSVHLARSRPDFRQAVGWVRELALAIAYAHAAGVVHRDVKPANIMLGPDGRPQLMDFGLAKRLGDEAGRTAEGTIIGTPAYMAPEQARGDLAAVGPHSDQYSLGVVLYELLTGRRPFEGSAHQVLARVAADDPPLPCRLNPAIPIDLEAVCLKAMAKEPGRRYASLTALADDLQRYLGGEPVQARRQRLGERVRRWARRHRQAALLAGGVTAAVAVTVAVVWWRGGFEPRPPDVPFDDREKVAASKANLQKLGLALLSLESGRGQVPPPAICDATGKPLLSWRVALLSYLGEGALYERFNRQEPWDSPNNLKLLPLMPRVFEAPGVKTPKPYQTVYQAFVGPGAAFEPDPAVRVRLSDVVDGTGNTAMLAEAAVPVEWTRPADLVFDPAGPPPRLGGVIADGFHLCFCDGSVTLFRRELATNAKDLLAVIGRNDREVLNLSRYEWDLARQPVKNPPPATAPEVEDRVAQAKRLQAAAQVFGRRMVSQNNLRQLSLALDRYDDAHRALPPPAICAADGTPLLSWRVAVLPYLDQKVLFERFKLDEPWDGPHNKALLPLMPKVFAPPRAEPGDPEKTCYRVFVGPDAFNPSPGSRSRARTIPDGTSNTLCIVEADAVPWTKPEELPFVPGQSLPRLGGLFENGFNAVLFDGSLVFLHKEILSDDRALRGLIGWNDGQVADLGAYEETPEQSRAELLKLQPGGHLIPSAYKLGDMMRSLNNLRQLAVSIHNYNVDHGTLPPHAISDKEGRPLLSWRVALLPFLEQQPLYKRFKLDEPWDSPHNKALVPLMPKVFAPPGLIPAERGTTFYRLFVGPGAAYDLDPRRRLRLTQIPDGVANTLMLAEAGTGVPWTKPEELVCEPGWPLPKLGGLFEDGFHAAFFDTHVQFIKNSIYGDEKALRGLIGPRDGVRVDLDAYR